jgi:hypothetical protein
MWKSEIASPLDHIFLEFFLFLASPINLDRLLECKESDAR